MTGLCIAAIDQGWTVRQQRNGGWSFSRAGSHVSGSACAPGGMLAIHDLLTIAGFDIRRPIRPVRKEMRALIGEALDQHWSVRRDWKTGEHSFRPGGGTPVTGAADDTIGYLELARKLQASGLDLGTGSVSVRIRFPGAAAPRTAPARNRRTRHARKGYTP
jgi:hypothetical protein